MDLMSSFPKKVNAKDAKIQFRRRRPPTGGADDIRLGISGMGDDIWRELMEREMWGTLDDRWQEFRRTLELGHEIDYVDENGEKQPYEDEPNGPVDGVYD